jgi:Rps23 Pro-64 3,4-dihydroxylase Tpa1-like proline 4-hydroxylase
MDTLMNLYGNIDDKALILNDVLPNNLFNKVTSYNYLNIKNNKTNSKTLTNHKDWQKELHKDNYNNKTMEEVRNISRLAVYENEKYEYVDIIFKNVLDIIMGCEWLPFSKKIFLSLSYYEYDKYAGINWHDDVSYSLNYSLYIHDEWNENWGGETLIDTGRGLPLCVSPVRNSMVAIKNKVYHKVCAVTGPKKRRVLQFRGMLYE